MLSNNFKDKKVYRLCPICSFEHGEILHKQNFILPKGSFLPESYDVVVCKKCGFVYADTSATQKDYDLFYQKLSKYEDKNTASGGGNKYYDANRLEKTAEDISKFLPDRNSSILDIGCGNGGLLFAFKKKGYNNLMGLDPSLQCIENIKKNGINAVHSSLFLTKPNKQFDFVILSHVMEHVCNPKEAINNAGLWVKKDGIIYIEVPDASRYHNFYFVPYYYFDIEHINHFDENSLKNLVSINGFENIFSAKKQIAISDSMNYPAVYIICKKKKQNLNKYEIIASYIVKESIEKYLEKSKEHNKWPELKNFARSKEPVIIWGAGNFTCRLLENSFLGKCNIIGFIDKDSKKQGLVLKGIKILSPEILKKHKETIIVCSALYSDEIVNEIKSSGINNKIVVLK